METHLPRDAPKDEQEGIVEVGAVLLHRDVAEPVRLGGHHVTNGGVVPGEGDAQPLGRGCLWRRRGI